MLYIHQTSCISPQENLYTPNGPAGNHLKAVEPRYEGIPGNVLRRMSKSVRMGVGAALPLLKHSPDGILIGTGYGGMEDSIRFLNQIVAFDEGVLTPGTFVQSTANAIASQLGLLQHNRGYNITFVSRGLSFESALLDAWMLTAEHPGKNWLVGGVDEISDHNYRFECAEGWYGEGVPAGEGAAVFLLNDRPEGAIAGIRQIILRSGEDTEDIRSAFTGILDGEMPDLLLSGETGDSRALKWYRLAETLVGPQAGIMRFKHLCGESPSASAFALWLACNLPASLPAHLVKRSPGSASRLILIYNNYKLTQHSLILLERFL
ncbi:MAG TPA: beta-ketoacyl synthase chain length factor [Puia sp.]|nr:beta-ketoacyl synthase chain length factor [Puia sp.]